MKYHLIIIKYINDRVKIANKHCKLCNGTGTIQIKLNEDVCDCVMYILWIDLITNSERWKFKMKLLRVQEKIKRKLNVKL